jgi:hypothetical protein
MFAVDFCEDTLTLECDAMLCDCLRQDSILRLNHEHRFSPCLRSDLPDLLCICICTREAYPFEVRK